MPRSYLDVCSTHAEVAVPGSRIAPGRLFSAGAPRHCTQAAP